MFQNMLDFLFGCTHKNYSFPLTTKAGNRRNEAASVTGTYVACLDCGKELPYDWRAMKVVTMPHKYATVISIRETADEQLARSA
jgi:ribosomal protein S26